MAPGEMSPLSNEPSFMTIRWTVLSLFCHTMRLPCAIGTGFGLNDCSFRWPMMVTVTAPDDEEGVVDEVDGLDEEPFPLHPHAASTNIATASIRDRMATHYARQMPKQSLRNLRNTLCMRRAMFTEAVRVYVFQVSRRYLAR